MKRQNLTKILPLAFILVWGCYQIKTQTFEYPETNKIDTVDDYHGTKIADPYRWLEDDNSEETAAWVKAQNELTLSYLEQIPFRNEIKNRLEEIWNYPKYSAPFKEGSRYYFYKNNGLQNQYVLYVQESLEDDPEVILNPNTFSEDGTVALSGTDFSQDGRYMGYSVSQAGSDWREFYIIDMKTREKLDDHIEWVKFSGMAWADNGFYYTRFPKPGEGGEKSSVNENERVFYHKLGTKQSEDELVFEDAENPKIGNYMSVTEDGRYGILYRYLGTHGTSIKILDRRKENPEFETLIEDYTYDHAIIDNDGDFLLMLTTQNAPKQRVVKVDPQNPGEENWETLIPESEHTLRNVSAVGGKLVANYLQDASTRIKVFSREGSFEKEITLPSIGTASGFGGKSDQTETFYSFTSFTRPSTIYRYDFTSERSSIFRKSEVSFNSEEYETKQVFFSSKDGTSVPMFIVHKKGLVRDGSNPTLLYAYGGFNVSRTPYFSISNIVFLERGGVYALANIRGGGEYGEDWHQGGMLHNKQNVFDDFIAAAEHLIAQQYTSSDHLAIKGGSNGGLLIGAVVNQRPDLFKAAIPQVGVMDMLRYHKFTIGYAWAVEYGSSDEKEHFENLIKYSPLHNIRNDVPYPAIMITTADHDDRVVPAHSFKYAAELQEKQAGFGNPTLIRIETKAGHGAGKPTAKAIEEQADIWSFILFNVKE